MKNDNLEPLTIDTLLFSLMAINYVFRVQRDEPFDIFPVKIQAPFDLKDFSLVNYELKNALDVGNCQYGVHTRQLLWDHRGKWCRQIHLSQTALWGDEQYKRICDIRSR